MHTQAKYIFIASMDVEAAHEDLFNAVYDSEHIPFLLAVPGVRSVSRLKGVPFTLALADGFKEMPAPDPLYTAIYEIDHPDVLRSAEWAQAVGAGRWGTEVRQHVRNRHYAVYSTMSSNMAR
jgi:hypothetical protein